jgi:hypothetical protein
MLSLVLGMLDQLLLWTLSLQFIITLVFVKRATILLQMPMHILTEKSLRLALVHGLRNRHPNFPPFVEGKMFSLLVFHSTTHLISESGWPSSGGSNGLAIPSKSNQAVAKASILSSLGNKCVLFSAFDDSWKSPGTYGVEQHWVCILESEN